MKTVDKCDRCEDRFECNRLELTIAGIKANLYVMLTCGTSDLSNRLLQDKQWHEGELKTLKAKNNCKG